jgi:hypothetical protein
VDTGWVLYGAVLIAGALLTFDLRQGPRPIAIVVGMVERAVIYPIMIGHVLLGRTLTATRQTGMRPADRRRTANVRQSRRASGCRRVRDRLPVVPRGSYSRLSTPR